MDLQAETWQRPPATPEAGRVSLKLGGRFFIALETFPGEMQYTSHSRKGTRDRSKNGLHHVQFGEAMSFCWGC